MRVLLLIFMSVFMQSCSKPLEPLMKIDTIGIISIKYDPTIYHLNKNHGIDFSNPYSLFSKEPSQTQTHVMILNEFVTDFMTKTVDKSGISIVRPLKLLNTTDLQEDNSIIRYEYLLKPYDPIDFSDYTSVAGLSWLVSVDAVAEISISYGIYLDEKTLWEEYKDPYAETLNSKRLQLDYGHASSELRTLITLTVVDSNANLIYKETRFVDSISEQIQIDDRDLSFDGGVSPKLLRLGLKEWLDDWINYLPDYLDRV